MKTGRRRLATAAACVALLAFTAVPVYAATDTVVPTKPEPVLVVRSFKTSPPALTVGGRFKLDLILDSVVNVDADNVVVTLGASTAAGSASSATTGSASGAVPEVVVLGTNTRTLGTIAGKATNHAVSFDVMSNPKGFPGPYSLPVTIEMDNPNGGRITSVQSVGLMFTRTLVFDVGALTYPREATAGVPFDLSVSVRNTNDFPINGVALSFEATGTQWTSHETTVGVLDAGADGKLVATGVAPTAGPLVVTMTISYKDDYNTTKRIRREITILVVPKPAEEPARPSPGGQLLLFVKSLLGLGG
jgi:hypothetical protein